MCLPVSLNARLCVNVLLWSVYCLVISVPLPFSLPFGFRFVCVSECSSLFFFALLYLLPSLLSLCF